MMQCRSPSFRTISTSAEIKTESKASGKYNILEKIIKLGINSGYGKTAQSIDGGGNDEPPRMANPWYAAAITAWTRRKIMEAALTDPYAIVFFATDGIISARGLAELENVLKNGEPSRLGAWEHGVATKLIAIQSGVYSYRRARLSTRAARADTGPVSFTQRKNLPGNGCSTKCCRFGKKHRTQRTAECLTLRIIPP